MEPLITTIEARCRDCYRCVRACPVKAIRIRAGPGGSVHAEVVDERCLHDGRCVAECPQKAKRVRSEMPAVLRMLANGQPVAATLAPSFVTAFSPYQPGQVVAALRRLGFSEVHETAVGAEMVADISRRLLKQRDNRQIISSACPAIVNLVEKYYPELVDCLSPVVSPMIAHSRYLKSVRRGLSCVFIGPCIGKLAEAKRPELQGGPDACLGFQEVKQWFADASVEIGTLAPEEPDGAIPDAGRLFCIEGGQLGTTGLSTDMLDTEVFAASGIDSSMQALERLRSGGLSDRPVFMELLACKGGCINGPLVGEVLGQDLFAKRLSLVRYRRSASSRTDATPVAHAANEALIRSFSGKPLPQDEPGEEDIRRILEKTDKFRAEDELNCGACGYSSCREKARAVYHGYAEVQMCIPYMRKKAESTAALVLNFTPNGIITVGEDLVIKEINPAARQMFGRHGQELAGRALSEIMDVQDFIEARDSGRLVKGTCTYQDSGLTLSHSVFHLKEEKLIIGVFADVTDEYKHKEQLGRMKAETVEKAAEVISKQMKVAQEIAGLLGETTAETKVLLGQLIRLMKE
ncbi:MAG: [Fe-Fe] hydrogenase large subunit C-terminal domain-containing protein [Bacillota bacterium]